jgi:threonine dehydrogenase-like Zn-dependent dehydrogenase
MKAVVFHDVGDIRLESVPEPRLQNPTDVIVRLTASAICGTDLHFVRGTCPGLKPGTILGHEGVGIIEEIGKGVRNFKPGDRVVIPSTISCGVCSYCRSGYYSQCDTANPKGSSAGTAFFGGPQDAGGFDGLQAEFARIPFANVGLVKLPEEVSDDQAILLSDIFPTGYFGADIAEIKPGDTVAVFGCGPVGQFVIASAKLHGAGRIFAIDTIPSRLEMAQEQGAEIIDFNKEDPIQALKELCGGAGPDRVIDAVGIDAEPATSGPAAGKSAQSKEQFEQELQQIAPRTRPDGKLWRPGQAPSQVLSWAVESVAKAGTVAIIGVYPDAAQHFPIGMAVNKNLTVQMGSCNHRRYIPMLVDMVRAGEIEPEDILTQQEPLTDAIAAYQAFDQRKPGWIKVELQPGGEKKAPLESEVVRQRMAGTKVH